MVDRDEIFLSVRELTLRDKVRSCEIRSALNIEPRLRIGRFQPQWFGIVTRMPKERLEVEVLLGTPIGKQPKDRPRIRGGVIRPCLVPSWCGDSRTIVRLLLTAGLQPREEAFGDSAPSNF